jgi:hypothetical protein
MTHALSSHEAPSDASKVITAEGAGPALAFDPRVYGESAYDRITSMLMAVVVGAAIVVGWLGLILKTNQEFSSRVTAPLTIVEVFGGGGGSPDGTPGSTEKIDVPGADVATRASNNDQEAGEFEEPSVQQTPAAMLDAESVAQVGENAAEADLGPVVNNGGPVASGRRASKLGTGGPGLGLGPGDGGIPSEQRWSIVYNPQTVEDYARQLDALGVELAVVVGPDRLAFVSHFAEAKPTVRYGSQHGDERLYFIWQGRGRKASDVALLKKAGIDVGEGVLIQFYPKAAETELAQAEVRYHGRQPAEIRFTRFSVVPKDEGYGFAVLAQEPLR